MRTFLALLFLCVGAFCLPLTPVDERCKDPTYACQDLPTAAGCKVVTDCINDFWTTLGTPENVNNEICDLCKKMVKEARDQLKSNETQEELKEVFEGSCNLIPIKPIAKICDNLVDQFIPELIETLTSRMDPIQVCTVSGLCIASLNSVSLKKKEPSSCDTCITMTDDVIAFIDKIPNVQKKRALLHYCQNEMGLDADTCKDFLKNDPIILELINNKDSKAICGYASICPVTSRPTFVLGGDELTCEFCKSLVAYLKNYIAAKTTEEEFKTGLLNLCSDIKSYKDECTNLVNEYYDKLYNFIVEELDPPTVCEAMTLCDATREISVEVIPKFIPVDKHTLYETDVQAIECYACESVIDRVKKYIDTKGTHDEIKHDLELGCKYLPIKYSPTCVDLIEQYADHLIDLLASEIGAKAICQQLNLCSLNRLFESYTQNNPNLCSDCTTVYERIFDILRTPDNEREHKLCSLVPSHMKEKCHNGDKFLNKLGNILNSENTCQAAKMCPTNGINDETCAICQAAAAEFISVLKNPSTQAEFKNMLESACAVLPDSLSQACTKYVDQYADLVISLITTELTPKMICSFAGLCPAQLGDIECQMCQDFGHFLEQELMDPKIQEQIIQVAEGVCVNMPGALQKDCDAFIEQYGKSLLTVLAQEMDPSVICPTFCGNTTKAVTPRIPSRPSNGEVCTVCKYVVDNLDKLLENDEIDEEISMVVEKVCALLPSSSKAQCQTIVEAYTPYILQMIGQMADSKSVCQEFKLCTPPKGHVHLLGAKKCTFGPSYWCNTQENAENCNAVAYCKLKVW